MAKNYYRQALENAQADLARAVQQLDYWTMEVGKAQTLVKTLAAKVSDEVAATIEESPDEVGIQDIVFSCIRRSYLAPTAKDIRDKINIEQLYDLSRYSNPLAVIHQAIKRLEKADKVKQIEDGRYVLDMAGIIGKALINAPAGSLAKAFQAEIAKEK
ncbi:MAG TPA: hypothetical protein VFK06_10440 [Candidatus Angelobacter sp.]|nr:hypothetical protein [Candidatus Angelobacter sp.]